jgi:hypothetical protein
VGKAAEGHNAEDMLVIKDKAIAEKYVSDWDGHVEHSALYGGRDESYSETHRAEKGDLTPKAGDAVTTGYVALKNSGVVHRPGCRAAAKISERNLVRYATREDATQGGKEALSRVQSVDVWGRYGERSLKTLSTVDQSVAHPLVDRGVTLRMLYGVCQPSKKRTASTTGSSPQCSSHRVLNPSPVARPAEIQDQPPIHLIHEFLLRHGSHSLHQGRNLCRRIPFQVVV